MSVHACLYDCELYAECQQQQAQTLASMINLGNDYLFDSTWKQKRFLKGNYMEKRDCNATKDLTVQWGERVGKKMGYGNRNMWLLKLVWVVRNNFACEVYVHPFFFWKACERSDFLISRIKVSLRNVTWDLQMNKNSELLFTKGWIFGNSQANCIPDHSSSWAVTLQLLSFALTFSLSLLDENTNSESQLEYSFGNTSLK